LDFNKENVINKRILVELTFVDSRGRQLNKQEIRGRVTEANDDYVAIKTFQGGDFYVPAAYEAFEKSDRFATDIFVAFELESPGP